jgi:hypothetical protein
MEDNNFITPQKQIRFSNELSVHNIPAAGTEIKRPSNESSSVKKGKQSTIGVRSSSLPSSCKQNTKAQYDKHNSGLRPHLERYKNVESSLKTLKTNETDY